MDTLTITEKESFEPLYAADIESPLYNDVYRNLLYTDRVFVEELADFYVLYNSPEYASSNPELLEENFSYLLDEHDEIDVDAIVHWFSDVIRQEDGYANLRSQTLEDLTQRYLALKLKVDEESDSINHEPYLTINNDPLFKESAYVNFDFVSLNNGRLYAYDAKATVGGFLKRVVAEDSQSELIGYQSSGSNIRWVTIIVETNDDSFSYLNDVTNYVSGFEKLYYGNLLKDLPQNVNNVDFSEVYFTTYAEYGIHPLWTEQGQLQFSKNDHVNQIILFLSSEQFSNQGLRVLPFQDLLSGIFQD
ncbi:hypothetical protein ACHWP0_07690 [Weissella cibaria]|uniref:hypothetical protein n=1 Tax=Weissella cibaria TaxID=137591 RepID=UPI00376ECE52